MDVKKILCTIVMLLMIYIGSLFAQSKPSYTYSISTHTFTSSEGWSVSRGVYAGGGSVAKGDIFDISHQNNVNSTGVKNFGPLPVGIYLITKVDGSITTNTIILEPQFSTWLGRDMDTFRIHGDSIANPGKGSRGCIILGSSDRQKIVDALKKNGNLMLTVTR